jgi:alginate O-acetyltransferase complex protein AlgJ
VRRIVAIGIASLLCLPLLAGLLGQRAEAIENRPLATWPTLSLNPLLDRATSRDLGAYLSDHLPLREHAIRLRARVALDLWNDSPSDAVFLGEAPWLFLGETFFNACTADAHPERVAAKLGRLDRILEDSGRQLVIAIVPDKASIYPEHLDASLPLVRCAAEKRRRLRTAMRDEKLSGDLDLWGVFHVVKLRTPSPLLYIPNDTHWSPWGALQTTRRAIRQIAPDLWLRDEVRQPRVDDHEGDLTRMIGLPSRLPVPFYRIVRPRIAVKPLPSDGSPARLSETHRYRASVREGAPPEPLLEGNLLLIHDSFGAEVMPMLRSYFAETRAAHWKSTGRSVALAAAMGEADVVLLVVAERNAYGWIDRTFSAEALLDGLPRFLPRDES